MEACNRIAFLRSSTLCELVLDREQDTVVNHSLQNRSISVGVHLQGLQADNCLEGIEGERDLFPLCVLHGEDRAEVGGSLFDAEIKL